MRASCARCQYVQSLTHEESSTGVWECHYCEKMNEEPEQGETTLETALAWAGLVCCLGLLLILGMVLR